MWIMIITFLLYSDPTQGRFSPAVNSIAFSSKNTCEAARDVYLAELKPISEQINKSANENIQLGVVRAPNGVIISAICVAQ